MDKVKQTEGAFYRSYIKRLLESVLTLINLIYYSLLILLVAILVKVKLDSSTIFKQERQG
ncbi:hypothetical protein D8M03_11875 [Lysinibacillus endophyticus]|uniref:Uncharacterized protein n=1 Tax=Ureibacillus endophyticus TaxID=1978490 RepID=A0A494YZ11_9BACL|nr:hypothetical protein D8M03_11875 [Lysinibacillus endophyticus]